MSRFETSDGLSLYYEIHDFGNDSQGAQDRPPQVLICLPGLTRDGQDFRYFVPHVPEIAPGWHVVCLDQRGRGRSEYAQDPMTYSLLQEARDCLALMDHLGLERAAILGTSRGGLVAMTLALMAPQRLSAVILNDVGPDIAPEGMARIFDYLGRRPAARDLDSAAQALERAMAGSFRNVPQGRWREEAETFYTQTDSGLELRYDARLRDALLAQAAALAALDPPPTEGLWPGFMALGDIPCGVIHGAGSDILSDETCDAMKARMPGLHLVHLEDRGHVPFLDEPAALALIGAVLTATPSLPKRPHHD